MSSSTLLLWGQNFCCLNLCQCPISKRPLGTHLKTKLVYYLWYKGHGAPCGHLGHLRKRVLGGACYKQEFVLGEALSDSRSNSLIRHLNFYLRGRRWRKADGATGKETPPPLLTWPRTGDIGPFMILHGVPVFVYMQT